MAKKSEKGLIAKKIGMTQVALESGKIVPVTLLQIANQKVTKVLSGEKDGYEAYQVGYFEKAEKNLTKPDLGRLRKNGVDENFSRFTEFRTSGEASVKVGEALTAEHLKGIEALDVTGLTKGRGFQGAVKRWGSTIGRMTHGSRFHRRPGSLGANSSPGRVMKNKHQPGQMGVVKRTALNVKVINIDVENNVIAVRGSVPGWREGFVEIRESVR